MPYALSYGPAQRVGKREHKNWEVKIITHIQCFWAVTVCIYPSTMMGHAILPPPHVSDAYELDLFPNYTASPQAPSSQISWRDWRRRAGTILFIEIFLIRNQWARKFAWKMNAYFGEGSIGIMMCQGIRALFCFTALNSWRMTRMIMLAKKGWCQDQCLLELRGLQRRIIRFTLQLNNKMMLRNTL